MTINLAIERSADFIVTRDNDLLYLNDDPTFQRLCPHTRIVSPVEFLQAVAEWKGS
jgi:predicted nucleic acid-binding protein